MGQMMLGFHCSHEQHSPSALLTLARQAADAGFTQAMCSDHFRPWSDRQGHAGFAWSWLGAALEATPMTFGTVCAPGQRYHPAIVAQAAATLAGMYPGRFWLALGSGEALNEAITGEAWPSKRARQTRLVESAEVMRALWRGETVDRRGAVVVNRARLYCDGAQPPLLLGAALTPETARWLAGWADGLITVAAPRDSMRAVVDAFREGGGADKPMFLQVALSFASSQHEAEAATFDQWRQCVLSTDQIENLETPEMFDEASRGADPAQVVSCIRTSSDIERHLAWLHEDAAMGFSQIYLHNLARDHQRLFLEACETRLLPALRDAWGGP